jgi:hypothetical protein
VRLLSPSLRRLALTVHIVVAVGWLGAVLSFLALAVTGLVGSAAQTVRAAYLAASVITGAVIVPVSLAALLSGLVMALGTPWGLVRHYWVLVKFLLTVVAVALLLLHTQPIGLVATVAAERPLAPAELQRVRIRIAADAGAAVVLLLTTTTLSVDKPRGLTPFGQRARRRRVSAS